MKVAFRKKRGLCTLLLVLCCGSTWSLNQRTSRKVSVDGSHCPRLRFMDLWTTEPSNDICVYDDVYMKKSEQIEELLSQVSNMTEHLINDEENLEKADKIHSDATNESSQRSGQQEVSDDRTLTVTDIPHPSEDKPSQNSAEQFLPDQESDKANATLGSEDNFESNKNETENVTVAILNDSIIQGKETMPSFDEWKKIRLEQEMHDPALQPTPKEVEHRETVKGSERKRGRRNYASIECGAKLVSANPGAEGASKVLLEAKDEYMLNPCNSLEKGGMFFIVELCESIHPTHIELANFELYSSTGKEFVVYMSDHYQSREWTQIGKYEMAHLKTVQSFPLDAPGFGKVIKVEFLSIYENNQYYCPMSLVRVFGNSMVDDYEEKVSEDSNSPNPVKSADEQVVVEPTPVVTVTLDENMVSRAKKAMINIISSVSKAVSGTQLLEGNCTECISNETKDVTSPFGQQFNNCFELSNLSGNLWPSMKCRFAEVAQVHRSCRSLLPLVAPIRIEPSSLKIISGTSVSFATATSSASSVAPVTITSELIAPTRVSAAEPKKEMKTSTVIPVKVTEQNNDKDVQPSTPQSVQSQQQQQHQQNQQLHQQQQDQVPTVAQKAEEKPAVEQQAENHEIPSPQVVTKPNVKIPPLSHINPIQSSSHSNSASTTKNSNSANQATKENLFSRFENRIKQLELNMNLSGTYLEELSKRYRNQMEEMQAAFNKTVAALNMEAKKGLERDQNQQQALAALQEKLTAATESLRELEIEHDSLWWRLLLVYVSVLITSMALFVVFSQIILRRTIATYVWSDNIERRMLEVLERERKSASTEQGKMAANNERPLKTESEIKESKNSDEPEKMISPVDDTTVKQECANDEAFKSDEIKTEVQMTNDKLLRITKSVSAPEFPRKDVVKVSLEDAEREPNEDQSIQSCTKCALSFCTHALLRH